MREEIGVNQTPDEIFLYPPGIREQIEEIRRLEELAKERERRRQNENQDPDGGGPDGDPNDPDGDPNDPDGDPNPNDDEIANPYNDN